jgi:predicted nucleotidyltransferase
MGADENTAISQLAAKVGAAWPCIAAAEEAAKAMRAKLGAALGQAKLVDSDCAVVVFGSLARDEFTAGSDVDWTLLVDGAANPQHLLSSQGIAAKIAAIGGKKPGPTGVFGAMA